MNAYELLRVIDFLEKARDPFRRMMPIWDDDPAWRMVTHLVKSHAKGRDVAISALANVADVPYATAMRRIKSMIADGHIERIARPGGRSFGLRPSEALCLSFQRYAEHIKRLLAQTFGLRAPSDDEDDYYFGGAYLAGQIIPPLSLLHKRRDEKLELRFLLHDDNYFAAMRNMWSDFRSNLASRRNFDLAVLPALHEAVERNGALAQSRYDVITLNLPWLGEFVARGLVQPLDGLLAANALNPMDFHPAVWSTGRWQGVQFGVPIYCTIEVLAARRDLFEQAGCAFPRSFAEVLTAGRALHAPHKEQYGITWNPARGMPVANAFLFFVGCCGASLFTLPRAGDGFSLDDLDLRTIRPAIDTPAARTTLAYMHELLAISPPDALDLSWNRSLDVFMTGHAAMAYCWTMRAARFEYDLISTVKQKVEYLPQPAGPGGQNVSPIGGFLLAVPANLPPERARLAAEGIAWMASPEAMKASVRNGFPVAPRFSVSADPEAAASSPIVRFVDRLAKRNLLQTWQRPPVPQFAQVEEILGTEIHDALAGRKTDARALADAQARADRLFDVR
jgi:multiple sugar transport system substrate-binding protein